MRLARTRFSKPTTTGSPLILFSVHPLFPVNGYESDLLILFITPIFRLTTVDAASNIHTSSLSPHRDAIQRDPNAIPLSGESPRGMRRPRRRGSYRPARLGGLRRPCEVRQRTRGRGASDGRHALACALLGADVFSEPGYPGPCARSRPRSGRARPAARTPCPDRRSLRGGLRDSDPPAHRRPRLLHLRPSPALRRLIVLVRQRVAPRLRRAALPRPTQHP